MWALGSSAHKIGHVFESMTPLVIIWEASVSTAAYLVMLLGSNGEAEPPPFCVQNWEAKSSAETRKDWVNLGFRKRSICSTKGITV